ncbi:MAG: histidine--tRNA ligase [Acidobacteriota bacterium]|nr:histidine--tRNA ligase [Acidobacteriota bacterium]MDH3785374.1 histidine--tRNA ligase [Acidobacteriota bacterium]
MKTSYRALRGTHDILPEEAERWQYLERVTREIFRRYDFGEIRTPILEHTALFARSVGESSDIVRKEMYSFDRGDDSLTLRPENTAAVVRAFIEQSMHRGVATGYPERLFYIGPMFRYERPQKGRQRQFHQIGVEVLGAADPAVDAETIRMSEDLLDAIGLHDREVRIASVGDEACRPAYREALRAWLEPRSHEVCEDCQRRIVENPLRVFDCKHEADQLLYRDAPMLADHLCDPCRSHDEQVCRTLDRLGVSYNKSDRLVRGLDYYRRTVFETVATGLGAQDAVLGGGRYDGLVEELGGPPMPGFGFAMGMERMLLLMPEDRAERRRPDVALIALGDDAWWDAISWAHRLREAGLAVTLASCPRKMGAQLKRATKRNARFALFVGDDEKTNNAYGLKNLDTGQQQTIAAEEVIRIVEGER